MRGRKALPLQPLAAVEVNAEVLENAVEAADTLAQLESAMSAEQVSFSQRIGERIGRRRAADALAKLVTVTDLLELQQIKSSKAYRGMKVVASDGKVVTVTTFDQFCEVVEGRSREQVDADLLNLKTFGADFLEAAQRMGIGYRELREMRRIPADQQAELLAAAETGDRSALIDVAESLIEKHAAEKAAIEKARTKASERVASLERLVEQKNAKLDEITTFAPDPDRVARNLDEHMLVKELNEAFGSLHFAQLRVAVVVNRCVDHIEPHIQAHGIACLTACVTQFRETVAKHRIAIDVGDEAMGVGIPPWLVDQGVTEELLSKIPTVKSARQKAGKARK